MTTGNDIVPFLDLIAPHRQLERELLDVAREVLLSAAFVGGPCVSGFESSYAQYCDVPHCVGVASGTDALRFALMAVGVESGDIVITVPNTFVATVEAIKQSGAEPAFVDIDPATFNMSVEALREYLEESCEHVRGQGHTIHRASGRIVRAVVPVHLYGQMCDMDSVMELAAAFDLLVVEDACQAHGSEYYSSAAARWVKAGSVGAAAAFSFYPGKNLGACGEGGAVTTKLASVDGRVRMLRDHGQTEKYHHSIEGYNGRLDALQAGFLSVKLAYLDEWNAARRQIAETYTNALDGVPGVTPPTEPPWARSVYHLYVIRSERRAEMNAGLNRRHIATGLHYPVPIHCQKGYLALGYERGDFPEAERAAETILSLPMFPGLSGAQQDAVVTAIADLCSI